MKSKYLYRAGFVQTHPILGKTEHNLNNIIKKYSISKNDITVFPELATCGYNFSSQDSLKTCSLHTGNIFFEQLKQISIDSEKSIVLGFAERSGKHIYNSSIMINEKGKIYLYRKTHLFFNEKKLFSRGDTGFIIGKAGNMIVGQMICFDWFFPESARTLALMKSDLIAHPANLVMPYCQNAMKIRTLENRVYAITANRVGTEDEFTFTGRSQITSYDGEVLKRGHSRKTCTMSTAIDIRKSRDKKLNAINDIFRDRRRKYYEI